MKQLKSLLQRFNQLSQREKRLLILGGISIIVALGYWCYWYPLQQWGDQEQRAALRNGQMQHEMLQYARQQNFISPSTFRGDFATTLRQQAQQAGVPLNNLRVTDDSAQFAIPQMAGDTLWRWLAVLDAQFGIQTVDITVIAGAQKGELSAPQVRVLARTGNKP